MIRTHRFVRTAIVLTTATVAAVACTESLAPRNQLQPSALADAFIATPASYDELNSSFVPDQSAGAFAPDFSHGLGFGGLGGPGPMRGGSALMFGGLGGPYLGSGIESGFGRGPFGNGALDASCTYAATTGVVTCATVTRGGLSINRTAVYLDASGQSQAHVDSTTSSIESHTTVAGTTTQHDGATSTVNLVSDLTVTGLGVGSAQRTVNGTSGGTEQSSGTTRGGIVFSSTRTVGDTTSGLVIPAQTTDMMHQYPVAGSVIRTVSATATIGTEAPTASSRREIITYDGSATATVVITHDGQTQTCTMPLPHGHLNCQ